MAAVVCLMLALPAGVPGARAATTEFNIIPIVGGDSDVGIGFGQVGDWARLDPAYKPYKWRVETNAFITFKPMAKNFIIPYQDYFVLLSLPEIGPGRRVRLDIRPAFTDESTLKFYGFGNASPFPTGVPTLETEYGRVHPTLQIEARARLATGWYSRVGSVFTYNWLRVPANGILAETARSGTPEEKGLLGPNPFANHAVELAEAARRHEQTEVAGWASAIAEAAYGPTSPDERRESELLAREPPLEVAATSPGAGTGGPVRARARGNSSNKEMPRDER